MADRVVSLDENFNLPPKVSETLAKRLADDTTPEGAAVKAVAGTSTGGGGTNVVVYEKFADAPALPAGTIVISRSGT